MIQIKGKGLLNEINWQELAAMFSSAGLNQRDEKMLEQAFRNSTLCWFGYENEKLVGAARAISDLTWSSYLSDVVVTPERQGKGYGDQLMKVICTDLAPFGKTFIYSVVDKTGFYRRHGFELLSTGMVFAEAGTLNSMRKQGYLL